MAGFGVTPCLDDSSRQCGEGPGYRHLPRAEKSGGLSWQEWVRSDGSLELGPLAQAAVATWAWSPAWNEYRVGKK